MAKAAKLLVERYGKTGPTDPTTVETKKTATPNLPIEDLKTWKPSSPHCASSPCSMHRWMRTTSSITAT